jgi:proton-translocating NADH-quinone oxidoreductase chain M
MLLAGILLKMGGYGLIRMNVSMFPHAIKVLAPILFLMGVINIIYGAFVAFIQKDLKKVVAFSSVSHMGIVLIGIGALNAAGISGAIFQMVAHGIISAGLFMIVGVIYLRTHTREIKLLGGLAHPMPKVFYLSMAITLAGLGLPLLIGFAAESLAFYGAFISKQFYVSFPISIQVLTLIAAIGIILTAVYLLWMLQRVFFGPTDEKWASLPDIQPHEAAVLLSLIVVIVFFGFFPSTLTHLYSTVLSPFVR